MLTNGHVKSDVPRGGLVFVALGAACLLLLPARADEEPARRKSPPATESADNKGRTQPPGEEVVPSSKVPHRSDEQPSSHAGAEVSLEFDKPEYLLGENVVLHWRIRNVGEKPLTFSIGGDGRTPWAKRAIRFKIEAFDAEGKAVPDPYPNPDNMGGMGGEPTLEPGQDFWDDLQLMRYREFTAPGEYTIRVYHDLGWEKRGVESHYERVAISDIPPAPLIAPIATAKVRFLIPNAGQARQVVESMRAMREDAGRTWGEKGTAFADFELLRYAVYLPIAMEMVRNGDNRGLDMIGAMAFPDATAALLELMQHGNPAVATKVGNLLFQRMPYVYDVGPSRRNYLVAQSWTDQLKKSALAPAWKLLDGDDREGIIRGARFIQSIGSKDDLSALIKVMNRVLVQFKDFAVEQRAYPRPSTASETLANASRELLQRGAQPPDSAATPGQAVAWMLGLSADENFRPAGWRETARGLITHDIPFIRDIALRNMPLPLDDATEAIVKAAIEDDFPPVQAAACDLAGKAKLKSCAAPLINVLESSKDEWIFQSAFSAAAECEVENDRRLEICVRRMRPRDNDWNMIILRLLKDGAIESGGTSAQAIDDWTTLLPGIQDAWLQFIDSHRQLLRNGTRFPVSDPPFSPKMFPPDFRLSRAGQPEWPEDSAR